MVGSGGAPSEWVALNGLRSFDNELGPGRMMEIQRGRVLAAMVEVSAERGAANVTVAHVVERAGVSRRTFYELFDDSEGCLIAAFDGAVQRACRYLLEAYDAEARWVERIRTGLVALLAFLDAERSACRLLIVGSLGAGSRALERRRSVLALLVAVVDEGRGEVRAGARGVAELPPLTAEGVVGGALSVLHTRLSEPLDDSLLELVGPLMGMIVLPYLGSAAARKELERPTPSAAIVRSSGPAGPLRDVGMRLTYRTVRVLMSVAAHPGSSNREIGLASDVHDQGQISKLLTRLHRLGLIENSEAGLARGAPNAWVLTGKGAEVEWAIGQGAG